MVQLLSFILGLTVGSFLNVIVSRRSLTGAVFSAHSRCLKCHHKLSAKDLIPLVSFFWLGKKCRYCNKAISWQYPIVEVISGLGFLLIVNLALPVGTTMWMAIFLSLVLLISVYDIKYLLIPNSFLYLLLSWVLVGNIFFLRDTIGIGIYILAGVLLGAFFLALWIFSSGRWIGGGDVKLGFVLGYLVGWPSVLVLFLLSFVSGAVVAVLMLLAKKVNMRSQIPFGPFLMASSFISLLWSEEIVMWYLRLF